MGEGNSEGSKLVIRYLKGSKLSGGNLHSQIYDLASRGLNGTEMTRLRDRKSAPP